MFFKVRSWYDLDLVIMTIWIVGHTVLQRVCSIRPEVVTRGALFRK